MNKVTYFKPEIFLSNKFLIQSLEPQLLNEKAAVLLNFILYRKNLNFHIKYLWF